MRLEEFPRLAANIVLKDWSEYKTPVLGVTCGTALAALLTGMLSPESGFAKGTLIGVGIGSAYGFAQSCFYNERQRGTLALLLGLPLTPSSLVLAKFMSAFSMAAFTITVPGLLLGDFRFLLFANLAGLLLTTVCMAATVVCDKPWAPQLPIWIILILAVPVPRLLRRRPPFFDALLRWAVSHPPAIALFALALIAAIISVSVRVFERKAASSLV
jgi:ABC-type Na+ efflux pump permease subunit